MYPHIWFTRDQDPDAIPPSPTIEETGGFYISFNTKAFSVSSVSLLDRSHRDDFRNKVKDLFNAPDTLNIIKVNDGLRRLWIPQYRYYTFILPLRQQKPKFLLNSSHTLIELLLQRIIWVSKEQILTNEEIMEPWGINYFHNENWSCSVWVQLQRIQQRKWTVIRGKIFTSSAPLSLGALSCKTSGEVQSPAPKTVFCQCNYPCLESWFLGK